MQENDYKIHYYTNQKLKMAVPDSDPSDINWSTGIGNLRLQNDATYEKGLPVTEKLYRLYSLEDGYEDLIIQVDHTWARHDDGTLDRRVSDFKWVLLGKDEEGNDRFGAHTKQTIKVFNPQMAAKEDEKRRSNVLSYLTSNIGRFPDAIKAPVDSLFIEHSGLIGAYRDTGNLSIVDKIETYGGDWLDSDYGLLDVTLRDYITESLKA